MSASPTTTAAPSQKRPLEEPSSPSGPGDQPDAKRPALDKIVKEDANDVVPEAPEPAAIPTLESTEVKSETDEAAPVSQNGTSKDGQGDTEVPDAPTAVPSLLPDTQPILTTSTNGPGSAAGSGIGHQDESNWLHVRAIISSAEAATVIGKGGENVTQIRRMSGAKCTVSDYSRGAVERILTVSGPVDAVAKAFGLIIRTLNNEDINSPSTPQSKTYPLRLLIPHILIGSIIGKGGVRIREIQEASGARLNASDSCLPLSTERSLVVLGVADAVHIATYYVGSTLVEQLTERFGGPAASAYATRSGGPAGVVPGGMQVVPYVPQPAGGSWGHPENFRHKAQAQRNPPSGGGYGGAPMHGQYPQQPQAPVHYGAGSPRHAYTGAGPHQPQQYGAPHVAQPSHAGQPAQPMQGMIPGQPITQQIFIPNDMVGAIIGKGGAKINEIRQLSGSVIKINEPQDNSNERLVTITGTQECNQMALYMLYSRLAKSSVFSNASKKNSAEGSALDQRLPHSETVTAHTNKAKRTIRYPHRQAFQTFSFANLPPLLHVFCANFPEAADRLPIDEQPEPPPTFHPPRLALALLTRTLSTWRPKHRTQFKTFQTISTILVGPTEQPYLVHREVLAHHSAFFGAALNHTFAEGLSQELSLPAEDVGTFELFLHWAYTGTLDDVFQRQGKVAFYLLLNLYGLADRLSVEKLRNATVDKLAELAEKSNSVPTPSDTCTLYDDIRDTALLRKLVVDLFAFKKTDVLLATHPDEWHPLFLRDLVVRVKRPELQAMSRHQFVAWKPAAWKDTKACWACRDVMQPNLSANMCVDCRYVFCLSCTNSGKALCGDDAAKLASCKPWVRDMCKHYHEHSESHPCPEK
ncbi:uncharacterized protein J3D65DRAFT_549528 [Phyllosticta citribraziliensis]|uniref:BTB domain-containing protein n=1 Tax=Phyllosticta citribraziliensis TaxID=989973 RepID=A0ABR1LZN9_9PEZI